MANQKQEFSFYFNFQRITNCDPDYLKELYKDEPNSDEIIKGILRDKATWDELGADES
ncbi:hypothetical protein ABMX64_19975 [Vibrio vulnificus]|uniref:hypothetical protein n=1 Tax=Vibrio vulnificus TaxID=672 RepID=UPI004058C06D